MRRIALAILLLAGPAAAAPTGVGEHELGARLGGRLNVGGISAGGVNLGGVFLNQLTEDIWLDAGFLMTFGGGDPNCYLGRDLGTTCDPALVSGAGAQLLAGGRWFFAERDRFVFSAAAGAGLSLTTFKGDNMIGFGIPLWIAGGARAPIAEGVAATADLVLSTGGAVYDRDQGLEPFVALSLLFGIDFSL